MLIVLITIGAIIGLAIAYLIAKFAAMLDFGMHYGGYLWEYRYSAAMKYIDRSPKEIRDILRKLAAKTTATVNRDNYHSQPNVMQEFYEEVAAKQWRFGRWICLKCMTTYIAMWVSSFTLLLGLGFAIAYSCPCLFIGSSVCAILIFVMSFHYVTE